MNLRPDIDLNLIKELRNKGHTWSYISRLYKVGLHYFGYHLNLDDYPKWGAGFRQCSKCGEVKPLTDFYENNGTSYARCKICTLKSRKSSFKKIDKELLLELVLTAYHSGEGLGELSLVMLGDFIEWNKVETILNKYRYTIKDA